MISNMAFSAQNTHKALHPYTEAYAQTNVAAYIMRAFTAIGTHQVGHTASYAREGFIHYGYNIGQVVRKLHREYKKETLGSCLTDLLYEERNEHIAVHVNSESVWQEEGVMLWGLQLKGSEQLCSDVVDQVVLVDPDDRDPDTGHPAYSTYGVDTGPPVSSPLHDTCTHIPIIQVSRVPYQGTKLGTGLAGPRYVILQLDIVCQWGSEWLVQIARWRDNENSDAEMQQVESALDEPQHLATRALSVAHSAVPTWPWGIIPNDVIVVGDSDVDMDTE